MYQNNDIINATSFVYNYLSEENICNESDNIEDILNNLNMNSNYVISLDNDNIYMGIYRIGDLLLGIKKIIYYHPILDTNTVVDLIKMKRITKQEIIPVIDKDNKYVGVINNYTLGKLIKRDLIEDYYRQAGFTSQEKKSFDDGKRMGRRIPALLMVFLTLISIGIAMTSFLEIIKEYPTFAIYQVLILIVSSAYAVMVNAKAIKFIRYNKNNPKRSVNFVRRELKKGFIIALVIGLITFVVVYFYCVLNKKTIFSDEFYASDAMTFAGIIALGLFFSIIEASSIGLGCPLAIDHLHVDPSTSSQLFVRTITSSICIFIYYIWVLIGITLI